MKAWRLLKSGHVLEVVDVDDSSRKIKKVLVLRLNAPMSEHEAESYMDDNYPKNKAP